MKGCLRFSPRNEFSDFYCHFSLSRDSLNSNIVSRSSRAHFFTEFLLLSGLVPIFWSPYANLLIQDPVRLALYMRFLLSSSLSLNCIGRSLRLACSQHEIVNLRIFNSCVKKRKYKASSLRTSSAFRKDLQRQRKRKVCVKDIKCP